MNRRRLLQAFAAATFAAAVEVTGLIPKVVPAPEVLRVNPEYLMAAFEARFYWSGEPPTPFVSKEQPFKHQTVPRFKFENGQYVEVPKYIKT